MPAVRPPHSSSRKVWSAEEVNLIFMPPVPPLGLLAGGVTAHMILPSSVVSIDDRRQAFSARRAFSSDRSAVTSAPICAVTVVFNAVNSAWRATSCSFM